MTKKKQRYIHFIGIAGSLIAPLAVAMKKQGWRVSGSDVAFYPPASTFLTKNKIKIIPGYSPDKFYSPLTKGGNKGESVTKQGKINLPNLAVLMSFLTSKNPEVQYLKKRKVEIISLGQLLERFFIKKNSIVVAGNYGKTTITALVAWILETARMDPTVLAGGYLNNFKGGVKIGRSDWSVSEGDEFKNWHISKSYRFTRRPRLLYQKPKYAILTDATWDHYDLYPSQDEYFRMFIEFAKQVPQDGLIIGNAQGKNVKEILSFAKTKHVLVRLSDKQRPVKSAETRGSTYAKAAEDKREKTQTNKDLLIRKLKFTKSGSAFNLLNQNFKTPLLGEIGMLNSGLAAALAINMGINVKYVKRALKTFKGVKRRQEIRFKNKYLTVIDDFAHSPVKLQGVREALRQHYPQARIILVYQPGSKDKQAIKEYKTGTFAGFDQVVLPRVSSQAESGRYFNSLLAAKLGKSALKKKVSYIDDDARLVDHLADRVKTWSKAKDGTIVLFAGQKGFRGMIENLVGRLRQAGKR